MTAVDRSLRHRAIAYLLLSDVYWALSFPLLKALTALNHQLVPTGSSWFLTASALAPRYVIALVVVLAWGWRHARPTADEFRQGLWLAAFSSVGILFQTDGLQYTAASTSSFLTQMCAILIPAWLAVRHRHLPGPVVWLAAVLVLIGAAILGHLDLHTLRLGRGEIETLICAGFFTCQILCLNQPRYASNRPQTVTLMLFAGQALVFCLMTAVTEPAAPVWAPMVHSGPWIGLTLALTLVCTIGATSLMNRWQPVITATQAGLIYALEPVFSASFAMFLPGLLSPWAGIDYPDERATWAMLAGGGLILLANVLVLVLPTEAGGAGREPAPAAD